MIEDIRKSKENYNHFIRDCLKQLKSSKICYVYNKEQLEEVKKRYSGEILVEDNECGYTIKIKRSRNEGKNI